MFPTRGDGAVPLDGAGLRETARSPHVGMIRRHSSTPGEWRLFIHPVVSPCRLYGTTTPALPNRRTTNERLPAAEGPIVRTSTAHRQRLTRVHSPDARAASL